MEFVSTHTALTLNSTKETANLASKLLRCILNVVHITVNILSYVLLGVTCMDGQSGSSTLEDAMLTRSILDIRHTPFEGVTNRVLVLLDVLSSSVVVTLYDECRSQ